MEFEGFNIQNLDVKENKEVINRRNKYINWGDDNLYPQYLLDLKETSSTFSVALDSSVNMAFGEGIEILDKEGNSIGNPMINKTESISNFYYKVLYNYFMFNGISIETISNREGNGFASLYCLPFQNVRVGKLETDDYDASEFYYSDDWSDKKTPVITYGEIDLENKERRQMFYWTRYVPSNNKVYPVVPYQSAVNAVALEGEIFAYHAKAITSNLTPNLMIQMFGNPTENERKRIKEELVDAYSGRDGQKLILGFSSTPEEAAKVEVINSTVGDNYYVDVLGFTTQSILTSFQISSPLLLGVHTFSQNAFSQNADEIIISQNHFINFVLKPKLRQLNEVLEDLFLLKFKTEVKIKNKFSKFTIDNGILN